MNPPDDTVQGGKKDPVRDAALLGVAMAMLGSTYAQWTFGCKLLLQEGWGHSGIGSLTHEDGMIKSYMLYACLVKVTLI